MTILASEGASAAGLAGSGFALAPIGGANQGERQPGGSSVAFAIAVLLIGFAVMGLWIAFHRPENAESGTFPGLFGQMLQWVHKGETSAGASSAVPAAGPSPGELQQIKNLPKSFWQDLQKIAGGGGPLGQWGQWFLHLGL